MTHHLDPGMVACPHCGVWIVVEVTADVPYQRTPGHWEIDVHAGRTEHTCLDGTCYVAGDHDAIRGAG